MTASKILTSAITVATILGAVGFVYAQTEPDNQRPAAELSTASKGQALPTSVPSTDSAPAKTESR